MYDTYTLVLKRKQLDKCHQPHANMSASLHLLLVHKLFRQILKHKRAIIVIRFHTFTLKTWNKVVLRTGSTHTHLNVTIIPQNCSSLTYFKNPCCHPNPHRTQCHFLFTVIYKQQQTHNQPFVHYIMTPARLTYLNNKSHLSRKTCKVQLFSVNNFTIIITRNE